MTTIAALLVVYAGVEYLDASDALACLAFGIVVGNSKQIFSALNKESHYDMETSAKILFIRRFLFS